MHCRSVAITAAKSRLWYGEKVYYLLNLLVGDAGFEPATPAV